MITLLLFLNSKEPWRTEGRKQGSSDICSETGSKVELYISCCVGSYQGTCLFPRYHILRSAVGKIKLCLFFFSTKICNMYLSCIPKLGNRKGWENGFCSVFIIKLFFALQHRTESINPSWQRKGWRDRRDR